jgi:hypothetical protein
MKEFFLTDRWVLEMTPYADRQSYCQRGHENQDPLGFLSCRLRYIRMLGLVNEGSPCEITELLRTAPLAWKSILDLTSLTTLLKTAAFQFDQLSKLARVGQQGLSGLSDGDLVCCLTGMGFSRTLQGNRPFQPHGGTHACSSRLAITDGTDSGTDLTGQAFITEVDDEALVEKDEHKGALDSDASLHNDMLKQAYVTATRTSSGKPSSKYSFSKGDNVRMPTNQLPPSPCCHCGSLLHWNKECPYHDISNAKMKATGNLAEIDDPLYNQAYAHTVNRAAMLVYEGVINCAARVTYKDQDLDKFANMPEPLGTALPKTENEVPSPSRKASGNNLDTAEAFTAWEA